MAVQQKKPEGDMVVPKYKALDLKLPTQDSEPDTDLLRFSFFIYGKQSIGKTTFTLQFPGTLHMMFEPGAKSKAFRKVEPTTWKEVEEYTRIICLDNSYKTIVIDTCDLMWDMCVAQVCVDKGIEYLKDIGFGDGYSIAGNRFRKVLIDLHRTKGLVILSHDKMPISENEKKAEYWIPSCPKRGSDTIAKWIDLTGHYYITAGNERYLRIRANSRSEAKCRPDEFFNYTDGSPIMDVPMGKTAEESFSNFKKAFNNELANPKVVQAKQTKPKFSI